MGKECVCVARFGKQKSKGKALLETNELIFRGDFRLKAVFAALKSAKAVDGELRLETPEGLAVFELGEQAAKWCDKILHPKSRIEKIGVKAGAKVAIIGAFDADFVAELKPLAGAMAKEKIPPETDTIFLAADSLKELSSVAKTAKSMKGGTALWIVYPKGQKSLTENDVIAAGRKTGLKDVKVVGFSATHTALKFVLPLTKR
jgi:hypothetical protein